jgi:hypothetical protein
MPIFNESDLYNVRQLDIENKLILPTTRLYDRISFKFNSLYQDVHNALMNAYGSAATNARQIYEHPLETVTVWYQHSANIGTDFYEHINLQCHTLYRNISNVAVDTHSSVAALAKQIYEHPSETAAAWYEQAGNKSAALYAQVQAEVQPVYQQWLVNISSVKDKTVQDLQAFLNNPEQKALAVLEPVTRNAAVATEQAERYMQLFLNNPEQFLVSAVTPVANYLSLQTESAKITMFNTYYALVDMFSLLASQPSATLHTLYNKTLSSLLDVYYDVISSLLVTV